MKRTLYLNIGILSESVGDLGLALSELGKHLITLEQTLVKSKESVIGTKSDLVEGLNDSGASAGNANSWRYKFEAQWMDFPADLMKSVDEKK